MILRIQIMGAGVDVMNFTSHNLKIPIRVDSKEITGPKMNPRQDPSGPMRMIPLYPQSIKSLMEAIAKLYGAGEPIFKMILRHACSGQQRNLANAIIRRFRSLHTVIISL